MSIEELRVVLARRRARRALVVDVTLGAVALALVLGLVLGGLPLVVGVP